MLALEVEYVTGRSVASMPNDRNRAEWPPHPGRLFMALAAAHLERDPGDPAERAALLWLETLKPPEIGADDADERATLEVFVPVNDNFGPDRVPKGEFSASLLADKVRVLPERRTKQPRAFASITPRSTSVFFAWPEADAGRLAEHREALRRLAANVTCLGHSSSMVLVGLRDDPPPSRYIPGDEGTIILRVPTPGRLDDLIACYQSGRRPSMGFFCSYREARPPEDERSSRFGSLLTFRLAGPRLLLTAAQRLTSVIRRAVLERSLTQPAPEILSGHTPEGAPSRRDHVAYLPLASVDSRSSDGLIRGFGVAIPDGVSGDERGAVIRALGLLETIYFDRDTEWAVERVNPDAGIRSLTAWDYERPSRSWATVTPMVFDRFPRGRDGRDAVAIIAGACRRIGLAEPIAVDVSRASRVLGVPRSPEFKVVPKPGVPARPYAHASLLFDRPTKGPVLLGAGRYQGLGLFRATDAAGGGR